MKRLISVISVITLLFTMISVPVMAEETNVISVTQTGAKVSANVNTNAAAYGFTDVAPSTHVDSTGTFVYSGTYYKALEADAMGASQPVTAIYGETTGKLCVNFDGMTSFWNNTFKVLTYGEKDRLYFSTYVSNLQGSATNMCFMPSSAGVNMSNQFAYTFPKNRWTKLDVIYNPNVTYTFTVDGTEYSASTVGKTIPQNGNKGYAASSANNTDNASSIWTPILALADLTFDGNKTYIIKSIKFGELMFYIDGELVHKYAAAYSYKADSTNFYFYDAVPNRFVFNSACTLALSNMSFGKITNFDAATYDFGQPYISAVDGQYNVVGGKLYIAGDSLSKSAVTAPEGAVVKAYKGAEVNVDGGYKYTEIAEDTLSVGDLVSVQENAAGGDRIVYEIVNDYPVYQYSYDGSTAIVPGNASFAQGSGIFGKTADDMSACLIPNGKSTDPFLPMSYGMSAEQLRTFSGYLHISYNMMVENPEDVTYIRITTDQGGGVAPNNSYVAVKQLFNKNQWNKVDFVIKLDGNKIQTIDKNVANAVTKTYVNGNYIGYTKSFFGGYNDNDKFCSAFRAGISSKYSDVKMWLDDFKAVATKGFEPVISAMPAPVEGNIGDSVASVTAQGARVYKDSSYKVQLSDEDTLRHGNVIVKETDGVYAYSVVTDSDIKHLMTSSDEFESTVRFTRDWTQSAIGGKAADDYSLKLTKQSHETDINYQNMYPQFIYNREADAKAYTVIALNLYVPADAKLKDFGIYSQNHTNIANTLGDKDIIRDKWISLIDVIDYTEGVPKVTMYVDGETLGEVGRVIDAKGTEDAPVYFGGSGYNQVRLSYNSGDCTDTSTVYMDDILVYETNEKFVPAKLGYDDSYNAQYDLVETNKIYVAEGETVTVAQVKEIVADAVVVRAGEELADDAVIAKGDVIRCGEVKNYVKNLYKAIAVAGNTFGNDGIRLYKADGTTSAKAGDTVNVRVAKGGVVVAAGYDASGAMASVDTDLQSSSAYKAVTVPDAANVSIIAVNNFSSLTPVCKNFDFAPAAE